MTINQLKCALEVAKCHSINKAAENLYISQSNLSRSISSLEKEIEIKIFSRTNKGIEVTLHGQEFLIHAESIIKELESIDIISHPKKMTTEFSIAVPKASYITKTFKNFVSRLNLTGDDNISVDYKETSQVGAITSVMTGGFNLGIIRFPDEYRHLFDLVLIDAGLKSRQICSFKYMVAFSETSELAKKSVLYKKDFENYVQILHGENMLPSVNGEKNEVEKSVLSKKQIRVYDSMGQLQMLTSIPRSFMVVFPLDYETLKNYHLVQRVVEDYDISAKDYMISKREYVGSNIDKLFAEELAKNARNI